VKVYTIDSTKYCAKNESNTMISAARRQIHPSCSANEPSDVAITVIIDTESNLMAVYYIYECNSRYLVAKHCYGVVSSAVYTARPIFVISLAVHSNTGLCFLPLHMHAEENIPTFSPLNIYMGLCFLKALTLT
jgi:hypothetical protein